jgi:hypothetical protein
LDANREDMKAPPGFIEAHKWSGGGSPGVREAHNGAVEALLEPWRISTVGQCCGFSITLARSIIVKIEYTYLGILVG